MPKNIRPRLAHINVLLLVAIICVNGAIIVQPLYPLASFWWRGHIGGTAGQLQSYLNTPTKIPASNSPNPGSTDQLRLIIPRMLLDEKIFEGSSPYTVNKGIWHIPRSSNPTASGNTVLAGHRFTYNGPSVFYHLDLLQKDDEIGLVWKGTTRLYTVTDIKTVAATESSIEDPGGPDRLTLYTCTPLWSAKNRLVVVATPKHTDNQTSNQELSYER